MCEGFYKMFTWLFTSILHYTYIHIDIDIAAVIDSNIDIDIDIDRGG